MDRSLYFKHSLLAITLAIIGTNAQASVITFDEISTNANGTLISNGYSGMNWSNWYVATGCGGGYGDRYCAGTTSGPNTTFNGFGLTSSFSSSTAFTLNSLDLTAAWNDGLQVTFTGSASGTTLFSKTVIPLTDTPMVVTFDWAGIDTVQMTSAGGTPHVLYQSIGTGTHASVDTITINAATAVPEPGTYTMMLAGLGALGFMGRRRQVRE